MRTSGASVNDTFLVVMTVVFAIIILMIVSGGPREFFGVIASITGAVLEGLGSLARSVGLQ